MVHRTPIEKDMARSMFEEKTKESAFILTKVSQDQAFLWGFGVFTSEGQCLARFTYRAEPEAAWAATNFAWVMAKIATILPTSSL
jgi:hypothetical protein